MRYLGEVKGVVREGLGLSIRHYLEVHRPRWWVLVAYREQRGELLSVFRIMHKDMWKVSCWKVSENKEGVSRNE